MFFDFPVETVVYKDSLVEVQVPIETKTYQDSTYKLEIQGFRPQLNYIELNIPTTTVTQTQVIYKKPIVSFGIGASAIWNPVNNHFDWGIGASVIVPIWSLYH